MVGEKRIYNGGIWWKYSKNASFDLIRLVMENENLSMPDVFDKVYNSRTYQNLLNPLSQLYYQSPGYVYACLTAEV